MIPLHIWDRRRGRQCHFIELIVWQPAKGSCPPHHSIRLGRKSNLHTKRRWMVLNGCSSRIAVKILQFYRSNRNSNNPLASPKTKLIEYTKTSSPLQYFHSSTSPFGQLEALLFHHSHHYMCQLSKNKDNNVSLLHR